MASPLRSEHGEVDHLLSFWVVSYRKATPRLGSGANVTTQLGDDVEIQPDSQLRIPEHPGGRSRLGDGYVNGPPGLVIEIGKSSRAYDLGPKEGEYEKAGVLEYLFVGLAPEEIRWFARRDGLLVEMPAGEDGTCRSGVFPGLWLDPKALFDEDLDGLAAAPERGIATPEHAAFVADPAARGS